MPAPPPRPGDPKTLRWRVFHAPARAIHTGRQLVIRLLDDWPDTPALLAAHQAISQLA